MVSFLFSLTESKSNASADCFRRRLNFISGPFLTSGGQATNPRIKSNAIRVSCSPERGKSNLGSGKGEILKARADVPASKWKTNHSENFPYARASKRSSMPVRGSSPFIHRAIIYCGRWGIRVGEFKANFLTREKRARRDFRVYATHVAIWKVAQ